MPPFRWNGDRRLHLRAKLDALYFHLYGITDRDDIRYIYSTFPIVERDEIGRYMGPTAPATCASRGRARSPLANPTRNSTCESLSQLCNLYAIFVRFVDLSPPTSLVNAKFLADGPSGVPPCAIGPRRGTGGDCSQRHRGPT